MIWPVRPDCENVPANLPGQITARFQRAFMKAPTVPPQDRTRHGRFRKDAGPVQRLEPVPNAQTEGSAMSPSSQPAAPRPRQEEDSDNTISSVKSGDRQESRSDQKRPRNDWDNRTRRLICFAIHTPPSHEHDCRQYGPPACLDRG